MKRPILLLAAATFVVLCGRNDAMTQEGLRVQAGSAEPARPSPTDEAIINACGADLQRMFSEFGAPKYVVTARGDTPEDDDVLFEYGRFILRVHEATVESCFFKSNWTGPVRGIKIGDSREVVERVLGKPRSVIRKEGAVTAYGYELKSPKATMWTNFNDQGAVRRVEIALER